MSPIFVTHLFPEIGRGHQSGFDGKFHSQLLVETLNEKNHRRLLQFAEGVCSLRTNRTPSWNLSTCCRFLATSCSVSISG
jgi:hypothetical protein